MKFHELDKPARKTKRRSGRGIAAGRGKTAGRGTKGQNSRSGGGVRPGFEGGQVPIHARLPKLRGFKSHRVQAQAVTTDDLQRFGLKEVNAEALLKLGFLRDRRSPVRLIMGRKTLEDTIKVIVNAASVQAINAVESAGGSVEVIEFKPIDKPKKNAKTSK